MEMRDTMMEFNISSEVSLMGLIALDPGIMKDVSKVVSPQDFSSECCKRGYEYALEKYVNGEAYDAISFLLDVVKLEPHESVIQFLYTIQSVHNAVAVANTIHNKEVMRRVLKIVNKAKLEAMSEFVPVNAMEFIDELIASLSELQQGEKRGKSATVGESAERLLEWYKNDKPDEHIDFRFTRLDNVVGGIRPGNLVVIAARPATGKSAMGTRIALYTAMQKMGGALLCSCEMSEHEIMLRYTAHVTNVTGK